MTWCTRACVNVRVYTQTRTHRVLRADWMMRGRYRILGEWVSTTSGAVIQPLPQVLWLLLAVLCTVVGKGVGVFHVFRYGGECYPLSRNPPFVALSANVIKCVTENASKMFASHMWSCIQTASWTNYISAHNDKKLSGNVKAPLKTFFGQDLIVMTHFMAPLTMCGLSMITCCSCCGCTWKKEAKGCGDRKWVEYKSQLTFSKLFMRLISGESGEKDLVAITGCCLRTSRLAFSRCSTEVIWRLRENGGLSNIDRENQHKHNALGSGCGHLLQHFMWSGDLHVHFQWHLSDLQRFY